MHNHPHAHTHTITHSHAHTIPLTDCCPFNTCWFSGWRTLNAFLNGTGRSFKSASSLSWIMRLYRQTEEVFSNSDVMETGYFCKKAGRVTCSMCAGQLGSISSVPLWYFYHVRTRSYTSYAVIYNLFGDSISWLSFSSQKGAKITHKISQSSKGCHKIVITKSSKLKDVQFKAILNWESRTCSHITI